MGGQQMNMKVSTAIQDGAGSWTATDQMDTPQGAATDTATLEKGSLLLLKRSVKQGPVAIDLDFAGNKAAGKMSMNGQDKPIAVDLGGPLFADAAGSDQVIACLPLAEGYNTTFRNFDVQTQKVKLLQLTVAGKEEVKVPAGTFNALRVGDLFRGWRLGQKDSLDCWGNSQSSEGHRGSGFHGRSRDDSGTHAVTKSRRLATCCAAILVFVRFQSES